MKQKQKKRFPFFTLPLPKFLTEDLKKVDDFVVMLRLTSHITRSAYSEAVLYLIAFCGYLLLWCLQVLYFALHVPFSALLRFVLRNGGIFLAWSFLGVPIPPARLQSVQIFFLLLLILAGGVFIASQTRRAFHEFRGLRQLHRMTPQQRAAFALQRFLRVSLPLWLSPTITYEPTPEELLALLRERERALEAQTGKIASTLADEEYGEEEQEEHPSLRVILTLTDHLSLTFLLPSGKHFTMELTDALVSLVAFLATRAQETWTTREELFKHVYMSGQDNIFSMHRKRIAKQITTRAQKEGFFPQKAVEKDPEGAHDTEAASPPTIDEAEDETESDPSTGDEYAQSTTRTGEEIDLFENKMEGQVALWRLKPPCTIEVFPFLSTFYPKVVRAQALPEDPSLLGVEELRQGCQRLMSEYGVGFLAKHMMKKKGNYVWPWVLPLYRQYREQCLTILSYAILRESDYLSTLKEAREQHTVIETIAQLYGWRAIVATGLDLKDKGLFSIEDMEHCLSYYGQMQKRSDARVIYQRYSELRSRIDPTYMPKESLQKLAETVLRT